MSVNCPNCGMSNLDESKFCMNCGTPLSQQSQPVPEQIQEPAPAEPATYGDAYDSYQQPSGSSGYQQDAYAYPPQPQYPYAYGAQQMTPAQKPKKKGKAAAVIIVSLIALLLVAAVVLVVVLPLTAHIDVFGLHLFDNSPKGVTERMLKAAYSDFNAKEVANCLYESKYAAGSNAMKDSDISTLQTSLDSLKTQITAANATLKYNLLDEYYVESAQYSEYMERMKKDGTDTSKIEKMQEVDFTIEALGNTSESMTVLCIKAEGRWYVSAYTFSESMSAL